jgi:hypothetical protein
MPRRTSVPASGRSFSLLFGGVWLLVGLPFLIVGASVLWRQADRYRRPDQSSLQATGTVLTKSYDTESLPVQYHVRFRFQSRDGKIHYGGGVVPARLWDALREMGPVKVFYLPENPEDNRMEGEEKSYVAGIIFTAVGGFASLLGGMVILLSRKGGRKRARR